MTSAALFATVQQPEGRGADFVAVEGDQYSGGKLLVGAYAFVWALLMLWILMLWRKQASLAQRLDGLEAAIDRAAGIADKAQATKPKAKATGEATA